MKNSHFGFIFLAIFVGVLAALLAWTLIVKQAVTNQLAAGSGTAGTISTIANLAGALNL